MRYNLGTVKGKRSKKVTTVNSFDSLTEACVAYDDMIKALATKGTTGITVILADLTRKTLVKAHQF